MQERITNITKKIIKTEKKNLKLYAKRKRIEKINFKNMFIKMILLCPGVPLFAGIISVLDINEVIYILSISGAFVSSLILLCFHRTTRENIKIIETKILNNNNKIKELKNQLDYEKDKQNNRTIKKQINDITDKFVIKDSMDVRNCLEKTKINYTAWRANEKQVPKVRKKTLK